MIPIFALLLFVIWLHVQHENDENAYWKYEDSLLDVDDDNEMNPRNDVEY